jgi:hypothetical protein
MRPSTSASDSSRAQRESSTKSTSTPEQGEGKAMTNTTTPRATRSDTLFELVGQLWDIHALIEAAAERLDESQEITRRLVTMAHEQLALAIDGLEMV